MAAKSQTVCYPSQANAAGKPTPITRKPFCTKCNAENPHTKPSCCTAYSNHTGPLHDPCSAYCITDPNTVCKVSQAYCNIGHEKITSHSDVGAHPGIGCVAKDEFIFRNWTATYWNSLIDKLDTAEHMGYTQNQGPTAQGTHVTADPTNYPHPQGSLVTAKQYNFIANKLNRFNVNVGTVQGSAEVGCENATVIRGAHAAALKNQYNNATFNPNVCDQCNTSSQTNPTCNCNCSCSCSCNCGCSCGCSCPCASSGMS